MHTARCTVVFGLPAFALGCGGDGGRSGARNDAAAGWGPAPAAVEIATPATSGSGQPFVEAADGGVWMSWTEPADEGHRVVAAFYEGADWGPVRTIARGDDFFVNWADFPSLRVFGDRLFAHWLQRGGRAAYDYGVRVAWSDDGGASWSEPLTPHEDGTATEHGFVSFFERGGEVWAAWLDGRAMVEPGGPMSLRARRVGAAGKPGPETVVDDMVCECCQTDAVVAGGVPVVVFRNRAAGEVRDIHVSRMEADGWSPGVPVHDDGFVFGGCPVNGPSMDALDDQVAVAWYTAPEAAARVHVAFSADAAVAFGPPVRVDGGLPLGRVDLVMLDDGSAVVVWLEQAPAGDQGAAIMGRRVWPDGRMGDPRNLAVTGSARASGFPRMARLDSGAGSIAARATARAGNAAEAGDRVGAAVTRILLAWTDPAGDGQVRAAIVDPASWGTP